MSDKLILIPQAPVKGQCTGKKGLNISCPHLYHLKFPQFNITQTIRLHTYYVETFSPGLYSSQEVSKEARSNFGMAISNESVWMKYSIFTGNLLIIYNLGH